MSAPRYIIDASGGAIWDGCRVREYREPREDETPIRVALRSGVAHVGRESVRVAWDDGGESIMLAPDAARALRLERSTDVVR